MDSFFSRYKNPLVLIAIVVAQVIALAMQVQRTPQGFGTDTPDSSESSMARRWVSAAITPIERILHGSSVSVRGVWSNYIDLRHTREQDTQLKTELARLREEEAAFSEDAQQGRRLQKLLDFKQQYVATTVAAQVIGTSGSDRARVIYLDKGYADGLRSEQAVITPDGIVGKLRDVFPHTAQVLLISDPSSGAGVILASTRIRGILRGTATGGIEIDNLTADSRIKPGEQVITSGGDLVFPRGIPVGTIESIAPDPQHQPYTAISIKPAADLTELEEVLVVTGTQPTLSPSAQQDAAAAQQRAEEQKRAADLVAEKLPSLHPDTSATPDGQPAPPDANGNIGGLPGVPNSGLPRPRTALHSDQYSPGSAPPAEDLTPRRSHLACSGGSPAPRLGSTQACSRQTRHRKLRPPNTEPDAQALTWPKSVTHPGARSTSTASIRRLRCWPRLSASSCSRFCPRAFPGWRSSTSRSSPPSSSPSRAASQVAGALTGTVIGLFQDGLTSHPFGVFGISKSIVGYLAASVGFAVDMENSVNRAAITFAFSLLDSLLVFLIARFLLNDPTVHLRFLHELLRAIANTAVGVPIYFLLDRFKTRD